MNSVQFFGGSILAAVVTYGFYLRSQTKENQIRKQLDQVLRSTGIFHEIAKSKESAKTQYCSIKTIRSSGDTFSAEILLPIGMSLRPLKENLEVIGLCFGGRADLLPTNTRLVQLQVSEMYSEGLVSY